MKSKVIKSGHEARNELIKGADFLADAVKRTLGPWGQNFLLEKGNRVTNDGVTIASEMEAPNEIQQRGLTILREAATKTNDRAGDGTTTAITLAQAILKEASRYLGDETKQITAKKTPSEVIRQIEKERLEITGKLEQMTTPIESEESLINSATVSVEDRELGEMIGKTQWELGKDGYILAEETAERTCSVEKIHGIRIDNGFGTSVLVNNPEKQTLELEDTKVIITDHTLQSLVPLQNVIDQLVKANCRNITIIARAFTPECIQVCLENINKGGVKIYPLNAPYTDQAEMMKDLGAVLGATFYHYEERALEDMQVSDVGFASKIIARRYDAIIAGKEDESTKERVSRRVENLKKELDGAVSDFVKNALEARISQLENGFAILKVGSTSEVERKRLKDKCDDAVNATRAAFQKGTVPGAGLAFKEISDGLPDTYILKRPLLSIYEQIRSTAPSDFEVPDWVRDPLIVLSTALESACSVAGTLAGAAGAIAMERDKPIDQLLRPREE
jgi:chaperonin GroEL